MSVVMIKRVGIVGTMWFYVMVIQSLSKVWLPPARATTLTTFNQNFEAIELNATTSKFNFKSCKRPLYYLIFSLVALSCFAGSEAVWHAQD